MADNFSEKANFIWTVADDVDVIASDSEAIP